MHDILEGLNPQQREAAEYRGQALLIVADIVANVASDVDCIFG